MSIWPSISQPYCGAQADSAAPAMASGNALSTVRRRPYKSMPMPMKNCITPNASPNSPANAPSDDEDRPKSLCSPVAMMAVTVRYDWLRANADNNANSMGHSPSGWRAPRRGAGAAGGMAVVSGGTLATKAVGWVGAGTGQISWGTGA